MDRNVDLLSDGRCGRDVVDCVFVDIRFIVEQLLVLIPRLLGIELWLFGRLSGCILFGGENAFGSIGSGRRGGTSVIRQSGVEKVVLA